MDNSIKIEMNHSHLIDKWIGFISGVGGGGIHLSLLTAPLNWLSFAQAMFTAFFCGAAGVAGKHFYDFSKARFKAWKKKYFGKIKSPTKNDRTVL